MTPVPGTVRQIWPVPQGTAEASYECFACLRSLPELVNTSLPNSTPRKANIRSAISCNSLLLPLHDHHFETVVMIEMNVRGGENHGAGSMLRRGQLLGQIRHVVVVHQRQGTDHRLIGVNRLR